MELEEGEIVISDSESDQEHHESPKGRREVIDRPTKASKCRPTSARLRPTCLPNYSREKSLKIRVAASTRRNCPNMRSSTKISAVQQRDWRGPKHMDFNKEITFPAAVASSFSPNHDLRCMKKNLVLNSPKYCYLSKKKSSNRNKKETEKRHKGSHKNRLLKKVISKSGPHSVPSSTVISYESRSLMSKLITAGLAKKSSDIEIDAEISLSSSETNNCNLYALEKESTTERKSEEDDEDSEIEVIIPPKKVHTVVTLDSDGEEVTHQLSGIKHSQTSEDTVNETQFGPIKNSKATSSLCNSGISKDQDSDSCENLSLRSDVIPLNCSVSEDGSISPPFTPSSPSSCNSIESNLKQVAETVFKLKEQIGSKTATQILPAIKNQVISPLCLEIGSGSHKSNQLRVHSQSDITCTSISSVTDSVINLSTFSYEKNNSTNISPILDSIHNNKLCNSNERNEVSLVQINSSNNKAISEIRTSEFENPSTQFYKSNPALDSISSTNTIMLPNESPSSNKKSNANNSSSPLMSGVFEQEKTQSLVSGYLNNPVGENVSHTNQLLSSGEKTEDVLLVSGHTDIYNRPNDYKVSKGFIHKGAGIDGITKESNFDEQDKECNDNEEHDCSNTSTTNIEQGMSHLSADIINTTSSFLCSSLEKPVLENVSSYNPDYIESSNASCIVTDSFRKTKSGISSSLDVESRQCVDVEKNDCHISKKMDGKESEKEKLDSDDEDLSKLRLLALSSKGKPNQSLTYKEENASSLEKVSQSNNSADDENYDNEEEDILLLRVAALKSAVIKKHEKRKKKGLLVNKKKSVSIDLGSIADETFLLPKEISMEKDSVDNIATIVQNVDLSQDSPSESLQGEEDMEISDSGDTSDNQEKPLNNLTESLETDNLKYMPSDSYLPRFYSEHDNIFKSIVTTATQPRPPGVENFLEYSSVCTSNQYHNYSQPIPAVLPPPPPPPALIFNSLLSPPPPPPLPESDDPLKTLYQSSTNITASRVESNHSYESFQEPEKLSSNNFARTEYNSDKILLSKVNTTHIHSENGNNIKCPLEPIEERHEKLQTIEITSAVSESPKKKNRNVNKLKSAANDPLRRNLKKIPLAKIDQNKTSKNKLQRLRKHMKGISQSESTDEYNESNSLIPSCAKNSTPLCITNTPIQQNAYLDCTNHNFPLCTTDSTVLKRSKCSTTDMSPSTLLCTENVVVASTNKYKDVFINQNSYSPKNSKKNGLNSEEDSILQATFQDEEMDLSNMIVLDEVGMSPEHKSSFDQQCDYSSAKGHMDGNKDSLRIGTLTTLSSIKHGPSKSFNGFSPQLKSDLCGKFSGTSRISKAHQYEAETMRDQASVGKRDFKNFSITKNINDSDSSVYKLTRIVTNEPRRSVVKGRESLKVVIPTETPPLLNSPQSFSVPVVERFVISVGKDSDSEEEGEWLRKVKIQENPVISTQEDVCRDYDLERSVDLLLSSTRQRTENALSAQTKPVPSRLNINNSLTPVPKKNRMDDSSDTPLHLLPKEKQEEYMRLKKIIDEKEKQKQQQPQKYFESKQKCKEALSVSTNHKKLNTLTITSKDRNITQTCLSPSSPEGKFVRISRDNLNVCIPNKRICNEKEGKGGALATQLSQRDSTNINQGLNKPSMVILPMKEKLTFMSKVENYLKKCLEACDESPQCLDDKFNKTKLIKECNTELSNDIGMSICNQHFPDVGNCVKTPDKIGPQHLEINNGLINNECQKKTEEKADQKSSDSDQIKSMLITLKESNMLSIIPLNQLVVENVTEGNICENKSENCQNIESDVTNVSSSLHDFDRIQSKSTIPDKAYAQGVLTEASETLNHLSKGCLANSQNILKNNVGLPGLNISTTGSLQDSSNCNKLQGKAINKSNPLSLMSIEHNHDTLSFQTSSNCSSIENVCTSMRNDSLDQELVEKEMASSEGSPNPCRRLSNSAEKELISLENSAPHMSMESIEDSKLHLFPHVIPNNSTDSDLLFSKQEELLCERFALMDELSEVSESLGKLEVELAQEGLLVAEIESLRSKLIEGERQLQKQSTLTSQMEQRVNDSHQATCNRHTQVFSLETSCQQLGTRLRGPTYVTPVRGKELLEKKMKQMCEKRINVLNLREAIKSGFECVKSDLNDKKNASRMDSRSSSKVGQSITMTKVDKQPVILSPKNTDSSTERLAKNVPTVSSLSITNFGTCDSSLSNEKYVMCPEIGTSRTVCSKSITCETNSSKPIPSLSLPAVEFSQSQREISQSYDRRQTKDDCLKVNQVKEVSLKRPISSVDSTSNTKTSSKKPHFEYKKDETEEAKGESKINNRSSGDKKTSNPNVSKVSPSSNNPGTSKLHYKSVLQFKSNRHNRSQSLTSSGGVLCPYDLMGQCQDSQCQYQHLAS